jgi:hypothetical protein
MSLCKGIRHSLERNTAGLLAFKLSTNDCVFEGSYTRHVFDRCRGGLWALRTPSRQPSPR